MQSDENISRLETASDAFTRLCGLVPSGLGVLGSLPSSFQDGVRSGSRQSVQEAGWVGVEPSVANGRHRPGPAATLEKEALSLLELLSGPDGKEAKGAIQREAKGQALSRQHHEPCTPPGVRQPDPPRTIREIT